MSHKAAWDLDPSYIEWQPTKKFGGGWIAHKSAPSAPPPPDYAGAAQQTAAGNLENLKYQTAANRANQYTPWGNVTWTQSGDKWTQNTSLSPQVQQALNNQFDIQSKQSSLANNLQSQVASTMRTPFTAPSMNGYMASVNPVSQSFTRMNPQMYGRVDNNLEDFNADPSVNTSAPQFDRSMVDDAARAAYHSQMDLMSPTMQQEQTNMDAKLRLQGLTPGTEAYNNAMGGLMNQQALTKTQVANNSLLTGNQIANQNYASALQGFGAGNQALGQQFTQSNQAYNTDLARNQLYNANQQQQYDQAAHYTDQGNQARAMSNAAQNQAYSQGMQNYQTAYQSALQNYLQPLNSMNAVLTGQQVQAPQFSDYKSAGYVGGADYSGAASALGQWNSGVMAQQNAANSSMNGLLGSAAIAGATIF